MSALWSSIAPTEEPDVQPEPRPTLRPLPPVKPRLARLPFIGVLIAVFGLGMTGLLMLNTTLQNQAFEAGTLNRQATELAYTQADLDSRINQLEAPQELAARASALGLRPNPHPAFLVLPSGKVKGRPVRVSGDEVPALVVKTPAEIAAERAAAAARAQAKAAERAAKAKAAAAKAAADAKAKAAAAAKAKAAAKATAKAKAKADAKKPRGRG